MESESKSNHSNVEECKTNYRSLNKEGCWKDEELKEIGITYVIMFCGNE